jgi:RNA polymerase sigma-70 factor (ECF subfamily)
MRAHGPASTPFVEWVGGLVRAHRSRLVALCRREGLGPEDAVDAVQEAFHSYLTLPSARGLRGQAEPSRKLLWAVTRNVARNRRRLHAVSRPHDGDPTLLDGLPAEAAPLEDTLAAAEDHVRLAGCLSTLGEVQRAVVTLRLLEERPGEDVARILGITASHVAVLLHRAKQGLQACMTGCRPVPIPATASGVAGTRT